MTFVGYLLIVSHKGDTFNQRLFNIYILIMATQYLNNCCLQVSLWLKKIISINLLSVQNVI